MSSGLTEILTSMSSWTGELRVEVIERDIRREGKDTSGR